MHYRDSICTWHETDYKPAILKESKHSGVRIIHLKTNQKSVEKIILLYPLLGAESATLQI